MEQVEGRQEVQQEDQQEKLEERRGRRQDDLDINSERRQNDADNNRRERNDIGTLPRFGESRLQNQTSDNKSKSIRYFKGLFGRIIVACFLFLLLFLGKMFSVNVVGESTESVLEEVRNNKFVESLEKKLSDVFQKTDQSDSEIEK